MGRCVEGKNVSKTKLVRETFGGLFVLEDRILEEEWIKR